jgi:hypothetical protein
LRRRGAIFALVAAKAAAAGIIRRVGTAGGRGGLLAALAAFAVGCGSDGAESLDARVGYYRELGFFESERQQSDRELVEAIQTAHKKEWDEPISNDDPVADVLLLEFDTSRVWWQDLEADVLPGNAIYVDVFREWRRISRGAFQPTPIRERWHGEEGPVDVEFELNGKRVRLRPKWLHAWIDLNLLCRINRLIQETGFRYEALADEELGQTAFVVVLTEEEARRLESERGWEFEETCRADWLEDFVARYGP